jgi:transcriptional regulator with XRE-family HTH domain
MTRGQLKTRVIRALSGLTQEDFEVAARLDNVARIEGGQRDPTPSQLARMCAVIRITPEGCEELIQEMERLQRLNLERKRAAGQEREPAGSGTPGIREILEEFEFRTGSGDADAERRAARNAERKQARLAWSELGHIESLERRATVMRASREFLTWAMVEVICKSSQETVDYGYPAEAEALARLAVDVAGRLAVIEPWRRRVQGFALAHLAAARAAGGAAKEAAALRKEARALWDSGEDPDGVLPAPAGLS